MGSNNWITANSILNHIRIEKSVQRYDIGTLPPRIQKCQQMARLLSLFLAASSASGNREPKTLTISRVVQGDNYTNCEKPDSRSFYDFTTEDIEKVRNVSFSDPEYTNKVLLVVNLASF